MAVENSLRFLNTMVTPKKVGQGKQGHSARRRHMEMFHKDFFYVTPHGGLLLPQKGWLPGILEHITLFSFFCLAQGGHGRMFKYGLPPLQKVVPGLWAEMEDVGTFSPEYAGIPLP